MAWLAFAFSSDIVASTGLTLRSIPDVTPRSLPRIAVSSIKGESGKGGTSRFDVVANSIRSARQRTTEKDEYREQLVGMELYTPLW